MDWNPRLAQSAVHVVTDLVAAQMDENDKDSLWLWARASATMADGGVPLLSAVVNLMCAQIMRYHKPPVTVEFYRDGQVVEPDMATAEEAGQTHAARLCVAYANSDGPMFTALFGAMLGNAELTAATLTNLVDQLVNSAACAVYNTIDVVQGIGR